MTQNQEYIENNFYGKSVMYGGFDLLVYSVSFANTEVKSFSNPGRVFLLD